MKLLQKIPIKYALLMCGLVAICLTMMEVTKQNQTFDKSPFAAFFIMIAPFGVWYLGLREYKKHLKGKMTYKQGLRESFNIATVYAILSPFIFLFYYVFINPAIVASVREVYQLTGATDLMVIMTDMSVQFVSSIIIFTLYGAIISFFLKSKKAK